jgi:ABC-2 type transport system permease protein
MKLLWTLALNDLLVASRDKLGLFWMLVFPLLLALLFGSLFPAGGGHRGMNKIPLAVVDADDSDESRSFIERLKKSDAVDMKPATLEEAREWVRHGTVTAYLVLPRGLGDPGARWRGGGGIKLGIDPSRGAEAGYLEGIVNQAYFARFADSLTDPEKFRAEMKKARAELEKSTLTATEKQTLLSLFDALGPVMDQVGKLPREKDGAVSPFQAPIQREDIVKQRVGNVPRSGYEISFPSSILWCLIGCVTTFATALVSERTGGTWLRLQVAPLARWRLLAGKGLACFVACLAVSLTLLLIGVTLLGLQIDSLLFLLLVLFCTAFCFTGLMMLLSTLGQTPEAVSGFSMFVLMPLAMIGGGMIPLMVMPAWMLTLSNFSPVKWGIYGLEGAIWRGFSFVEILVPCGILLAVGAVCFALGVRILNRRGA